jgi:hypothetical protein
MITIKHTPSGLRLTGHGTAAMVAANDPSALASAIRRIIACPASTPAQLGQRLAKARAPYLETR